MKLKKFKLFFVITMIFIVLLTGCQEKIVYDYPIETTELSSETVVGIYNGATALDTNPIRQIAEGDYDAAIAAAEAKIKGGGVYGYYLKAIAMAAKNDLETSWSMVDSSIKGGMDIRTYMAGPKSLLKNLYNFSKFKKAIKGIELIHGPMLGAVTENSAKVWIRTWTEQPFVVEFSANKDMSNPIVSSEGMTKRDNDFTGTVDVSGLAPDTNYFYRVKINGKVEMPEVIDGLPSFMTNPAKGQPAKFEVAFGACSSLNAGLDNEGIWDVINNRKPKAFIQLGDNTYIDDPTGYEAQMSSYYRRHSVPQYRRLMAGTSNYAVWDDHDFSVNDGMSSSLPNDPPWKGKVMEIFKENFIAPYFGEEGNPGIYTDFSVADVDFMILDLRYWKDNPLTVENPTHMGEIQKAWFFNKLKNSTAKFKVIGSGVPFAEKVAGKSVSNDTWDGYPKEKKEIYDFIRDNNIEGVVFIVGDRHRGDARFIRIEGQYNIPEFLNANLTNTAPIKFVEEAPDSTMIFGYNGKLNQYGLLTFDTTLEDPEVTYTIVLEDNTEAGSVTVKLSQLTNSSEATKEEVAE